MSLYLTKYFGSYGQLPTCDSCRENLPRLFKGHILVYDCSSDIDCSTNTLSYLEAATSWSSKTVAFSHMDALGFLYALII